MNKFAENTLPENRDVVETALITLGLRHLLESDLVFPVDMWIEFTERAEEFLEEDESRRPIDAASFILEGDKMVFSYSPEMTRVTDPDAAVELLEIHLNNLIGKTNE